MRGPYHCFALVQKLKLNVFKVCQAALDVNSFIFQMKGVHIEHNDCLWYADNNEELR